MQSIVVTGTDTEIGKTRVSCGLIRQLVADGFRVIGMKPVASGAQFINGVWRNEDALQLMSASNVDVPYEWVNPYCFEPAIAPHIAAQTAQVNISMKVIHRAYQSLAEIADIVVVEGVGGWRVPINDTQSIADIARLFNSNVVMVVGMRLGCINHALLTAESIQSNTLGLCGWIANILDPQMPALEKNIKSIQKRITAPLIGVLPFNSGSVQTDGLCYRLNYCLRT